MNTIFSQFFFETNFEGIDINQVLFTHKSKIPLTILKTNFF